MNKFRWEKIGLIFEVDKYKTGWLNSHAQAPASLVLEDRVRMYFSCRPTPEPDGSYTSFTAFVDLDRGDLTKIIGLSDGPISQLGDLGSFDQFGMYPFSPIPVENEIWGFYGGWTRSTSVPFDVSIGLATSQDGGISFKRKFNGPVLSKSLHEPFVISGPKIRKFDDYYYLFYIAGTRWKKVHNSVEPVYKIRMAKSTDGINWIKSNIDLIPSDSEFYEAQASPDVFFDGEKYHMFFCYRRSENFRQETTAAYRIGYAWSTDLISWNREDSKAGIEPSAMSWDSEMLSYPHVFQVDGTIYMAYLGNDFGLEGFGLARLLGKL